MGCIQSLSALSCHYPPSTYLEAYGCDTNDSCGLLEVTIALMTNSNLILDLSTHQFLLTLATQLFAGNFQLFFHSFGILRSLIVRFLKVFCCCFCCCCTFWILLEFYAILVQSCQVV